MKKLKKDFKTNVQLAMNGDTAAFAELYSCVYKELYSIALYNLRNEHDACDAVSETALDAFTSIKKLRDEEAFKSWIIRILFTKIKKRQKEYLNHDASLDEANEISSNFDYDMVDVRTMLQNLDDESKAILSLSVLGGYTSDEIGKLYGIKSSTVRSRLARIKEKIEKGAIL